MYGIYIYTNIGGILMVNVTIYSIHGSYGGESKNLSTEVVTSPLTRTPSQHSWLVGSGNSRDCTQNGARVPPFDSLVNSMVYDRYCITWYKTWLTMVYDRYNMV